MSSIFVSRQVILYLPRIRNRILLKSVAYGLVKCVHNSIQVPAIAVSNAQKRPTLRLHQPSLVWRPSATTGCRSIFIQTEETPNVNALKFLLNHPILPPELTTTFIEYLNPTSTMTPPYISSLASKLMNIPDVISVFYGTDFITVTKSQDTEWAHIKPEIFSLMTEAMTSGQPLVQISKRSKGKLNTYDKNKDSLDYDENDSEVVAMIKELLESRIRPAIQEDGGDIEFRGFEDGQVLLRLRGACRTCDSSTVTLKNGIEAMLMHYIEDVKGVKQVVDEDQEIAVREFARFEEKLRQQNSRKSEVSEETPTTISTDKSSAL